MEKCESCGKRANVAYNRYLRFLPSDRRTFCDSCFGEVQRKEDFTFIGILVGVLIVTISLTFVFRHTGQEKYDQHIRDQEIFYNANDLNKDNRVDFWEAQATQEMKDRLTTYGYPWEEIYGQTPSGSRPRFMVTREVIAELSNRPDFFDYYNFSDLMKTHFASITDPNSKKQLFRAFTTLENKIVFVIHEYASVPEGGYSNQDFEPTPAPKKGKEPAIVQRPEPIKVLICIESLSAPKIDKMMGIEVDEYHIADFKLTKGPEPKKKKKK